MAKIRIKLNDTLALRLSRLKSFVFHTLTSDRLVRGKLVSQTRVIQILGIRIEIETGVK